jgi:hypothetical protein
MKKNDILFVAFIFAVFGPFVISGDLLEFYKRINTEHVMLMSFIKFAFLATLGEVIGLRVRTGNYNQPGFGILPRAVVWGFLGLTIQLAFVIFATGTPKFLQDLGLSIDNPAFLSRLLVSFAISVCINLIFAPVMMTLHKITDEHIILNGGKLSCLLKPIHFGQIMAGLDWSVMWHFVFKKTIPFFWIPAHTVTFMLPPNYRILFAAALGIVLGVLLAIASLKSQRIQTAPSV